jgi:hypothetical protein
MTNKVLVAKTGTIGVGSTDPDDFVFNSDYDTLKYETQGTAQVTVDFSDYYDYTAASFPFPEFYYHYKVSTVTHGLGYVPYFAGYIIDIPIADTACQAPYAFGDFGYFAFFSVYADDDKLYFMVNYNNNSGSGSESWDFSYRIFKNDLGL